LWLKNQFRHIYIKEKLMDRNEKFRRRLENKLNQTLNKGSSKFDPTPYVNILMDNIHWEEEDEEEIEDSLEALNHNPDLDFILGRSSLLNMAQKQMVVKELQHRLTAIFEFDPLPFANELVEIWDTMAFEKYKIVDEDGDVSFDFSTFHKKNNFTKEQQSLVEDYFFEQIGNEDEDEYNLSVAKGNVRAVSDMKAEKVGLVIVLLLVVIFVITPSFFIPNYLQNIGWLAPTAGWFMKIAVGIMSAIALFFIGIKLLNLVAKHIFKIDN
jgi:hypothetical protein